jgi:cell wall assembly regulator SMI1
MKLSVALDEIRRFWTEPLFPFSSDGGDGNSNGGGAAKLAALEREFGRAFPADVREYIGTALAPASFAFEAVGNPFDVHGYDALARQVPGYSIHPASRAPLEGWSDDWLLIGDEGGDPIIVDLARAGEGAPVLKAMHGAGEWDFGPIADSPGQFLLLAAALHHALMMLPVDERIIDDARGFNLGESAAQWLFPRVRRWAPAYYDEWVSVFDNA